MPEQREQRARPAATSAQSAAKTASRSTSKPASKSAAKGATRSGSTSASANASKGPEEAARRASRSLTRLIGHETEGISAVRRAENGWRVHVDVLEVPRIPDTTSLLATYEVELDSKGHLAQYRRIRRYRRGASDD
ncbi:gas vesicle protein [Streptomyces diacarni]|uniref:Gas vesicle protein n=1 Tax=Streptomyces diacarni TaxID=2800381 RepID=A0A367EH14_9ACTN|nr:gas vesicle protein [Streptomyces diacarni]RCG17388.1 gas vesicle protein [Streptomyces diacarni]